MGHHHVIVGIGLLGATLIYIGVRFFRAPKQGLFPAWGWAGLAIIFLSEFFLARRVAWVTTFFTPIAWTGYLLLADALVRKLRGTSRLSHDGAQFLGLAFWSVPLWLIFEAYNLRLANWTYVGLPANSVACAVGYVWSFATIWPALYETADLVRALGIGGRRAKPCILFTRSSHLLMVAAGLLMLTLPVLLPARIGRYMFGAVWLGFVLVLDPIAHRWQGPSLLRDLERGDKSTIYSFSVAGLVCGLVWEFWNYWAQARWVYVFPIGRSAKIFEMPLPGYLGFPPFALECFVMYEFFATLRNRLARSWGGSSWRDASPGAKPGFPAEAHPRPGARLSIEKAAPTGQSLTRRALPSRVALRA